MSRIKAFVCFLLVGPGLAPALFAGAAAEMAQEPAPAPAPAAGPAEPDVAQPAGDLPAPNLILRVEGNRRWCVRSVEPVWPSTTRPRPPHAARRGRTPLISTVAYAHYVIAYPEKDAPEEGQTAPPEGEASAAEAVGAEPPSAEAIGSETGGGEAAAPEEAADAAEGAAVQAELPGIDPELARLPGVMVLSRSPTIQTMAPRRVQVRGQPPRVEYFWDNSRACCMFPSQIEARLPDGRYTIQVHFDAFMRRRGWKHVQVARITGVEVKEGSLTEVPLQVDQQGYVQVRPESRVVKFPSADTAGAAPAGEGTVPAAPDATPAAPGDGDPGR